MDKKKDNKTTETVRKGGQTVLDKKAVKPGGSGQGGTGSDKDKEGGSKS